MAKQLLSKFGKDGENNFRPNVTIFSRFNVPRLGLDKIQADIEDPAHLSKYFRIVEFTPLFTSGKNSISFNGSDLLEDGSEIKVECIDGEGNSLYLESVPKDSSHIDIANFTVAIHVYQEAKDGAGMIILVGKTTKGEVVRWTGNIGINKTSPNVSRTRFYYPPTFDIYPVLYPVINNSSGSALNPPQEKSVMCSGVRNGRTLTITAESDVFTQDMQGRTIQIVGATITAYSDKWHCYPQGGLTRQEGIFVVDITTTFNRGTITYNSQYKTGSYKVPPSLSARQITTAAPVLKGVWYVNPLDAKDVHWVESATMESFTNGKIVYTPPAYIPQSTTVRTTGKYIQSSPNTLEVYASSGSFTPDRVGQKIRLVYGKIKLVGETVVFDTRISTVYNYSPVSYRNYVVQSISGSHSAKLLDVLYSVKDYTGTIITSPIDVMTGSINWLTASLPYQQIEDLNGTSSIMQKSYVNILLKDINTFSGYVARYKLYSKSNVYPGEFSMIFDGPITPSELLVDQTTVNQLYKSIGTFSNQDNIDSYWYSSSPSLELIHSNADNMSDTMVIATDTSDYTSADGVNYVIAKSSPDISADNSIYYPYDESQYSSFTSQSYISNFIFLPKGVLHMLSTNIIVKKNKNETAKVEFFFTSSDAIQKESNYQWVHGLKIGEIVVSEKVTSRFFSGVQQFFFTPLNDYHGTIVIVPHLCNVSVANLSLKNYGDYGFSPGSAILQIPFPVNVANESFTLKAELFDNNYNLVYTTDPIVGIFDPTGASLFGSNIIGSSGTGGGSSVPTTVSTLTVSGPLFLPGIGTCPSGKRLLGFNLPPHSPPLSGEGSVCYTDVTGLELTASNLTSPSLDYLSLSTTSGEGRSLAVRYSGTAPNVYGRRVYVNTAGVKTTYL